jgi:hypothetical protein
LQRLLFFLKDGWFSFNWGLFIGLVNLSETLIEVVLVNILKVLGDHSDGTGSELLRALNQGGCLIDYVVRLWLLLLLRLRLGGLLLGEILAGERKLDASLPLRSIFLAD